MSRWQPGQSGNPSGRAPGSGHVAKLRKSIEDCIPQVLDRLSKDAIAGDKQAARLLLERVMPPLKAIELPLDPALRAEGSLTDQARETFAAAAQGLLAPGQAAALIAALGALAKIAEADELRERIERLEKLITESAA